MLIQVLMPAKRARGSSKKNKTDEIRSFGPVPLTANVTWAAFLAAIAGALTCQEGQLVVASFEWRWSKPANSQWIPLKNDNGLTSMLNKVLAAKASSNYVLLRTQTPSPPAAVDPWTAGAVNVPQVARVDEDELSDDPGKKKVRFIAMFFVTASHRRTASHGCRDGESGRDIG
jgi:hypothetical protein